MKIAAITGAGQGIGRAVTLHFARAGYAISIADGDEEAAREAAAMVEAAGTRALVRRCDVSRAEDVDAWLAATVTELGAPDVLINNAGIGRTRPLLDLSEEDFDRVIAVNLRGNFLCAQRTARAMVAAGKHGAIVNIASTRALMSEPDTEAYAASKGGIVALTHAMSISLGHHGIRVNCISPGWIEVRDWQYSARAERVTHSARDDGQHPVGRVGIPEDVAAACFFLTEQAGFITGQNLIVDGGMTRKMIYAE
jgi:NAD(P)-dependent dehydrogenase (short-subunit alcohol dehydrogenase family)